MGNFQEIGKFWVEENNDRWEVWDCEMQWAENFPSRVEALNYIQEQTTKEFNASLEILNILINDQEYQQYIKDTVNALVGVFGNIQATAINTVNAFKDMLKN